MPQGERTKVFNFGKLTGHVYPEVYYSFVSELHKHEDLIRAMALAEVNIKDGSALDFLNTFLGTNVRQSDPMEIGYAVLLDALKMRVRTEQASKDLERVAGSFKSHELASFPAREDPSKPIFPDEADQ